MTYFEDINILFVGRRVFNFFSFVDFGNRFEDISNMLVNLEHIIFFPIDKITIASIKRIFSW